MSLICELRLFLVWKLETLKVEITEALTSISFTIFSSHLNDSLEIQRFPPSRLWDRFVAFCALCEIARFEINDHDQWNWEA